MKFLPGISGRTAGWITASAIGVALMLLAPAIAAANSEAIIAPSDPHSPTLESGWQAGTCSSEPEPTAAPGAFCNVESPPSQFYETAAGHPNFGFTQFIVRNTAPGKSPIGQLKNVRVDLPVGLSVNPGATPRCPEATFLANSAGCPPESAVGTSIVTSAAPLLGNEVGPLTATVYNLVPQFGQPARFGLNLLGNNIYLEADIAYTGDYHEGFTIAVPALPTVPPLFEGLILKNRLVFNGRSEGAESDGTFLTLPSTCYGEAFTQSGSIYSTLLLASSTKEEEAAGYSFPASAAPSLESPIPPGTSPKSCNTIPYAPTIGVAAGTPQTNSPAGANIEVKVPHIAKASSQESSTTKQTTVTLPAGMGLNPSAANGLKTCTAQQFGKGTTSPIACPPQSKVGTVTIESPALPEGNLTGDVYVGEQVGRNPASGTEYQIYIDAESDRYGLKVRLIGNVAANPVTGQLSTTIANVPQVPFSDVKLNFDPGPHAVLSSPPTCGPNKTTTSFLPYSGNAPAAPSSEFLLTATPSGGPCAKTLAARPFAPSFSVGPAAATAGAYSPISLHLSRTDGQQELKAVNVKLAPGEIGKLAGIPYCPEAALGAAATRAGAEEAASSSCPAKSAVGVASILAGTGPTPYPVTGKVFLAGPYKGAPLSLAVITPAVAGPFDLGTVVVRVALLVDPVSAQVDAVSDPIPDVFGGAQLSIRELNVTLNRPEFTLNPTSCEPLASTATLNGGGADPTQPAAWSAVAASVPFRTTNCDALKFRPKLFTKLLGKKKTTRRNGHPKLRAILVARPGDANIARAALTLPHSQFLDQSHIRTICTRVQLAASKCPKGAIYGYARAQTPLLEKELAGPLYLVSSSHELPDLVADLRGQVDIQLHGVINSQKARIKTVFAPVPDVPVSKFTLIMKGGKHGLLVNSRNLCGHENFSFLKFKAQNGKQLKKKRLPLRVPACHSSKQPGKHAK
jgi:hypothetical protein